MTYIQPKKKILIKGTRISRQEIFTRDWLYLNLQSIQGCRVTITVMFKSDSRAMSRVMGAGRGQNAERFGGGDVSPRGKNQNKEDDLDFNTFNLGNGRLNEKKKRLALYVSNIINDKKNVKNCNETIRRILDNRQMKINRQEATMTLEGMEYDYDDGEAQASLFYNNNFVQRNANIMPFYREHENEKRLAMVKIRDTLIELAK